VLERYRERSIAVLDSPSCGAWQWKAEASAGVCQRDVDRRYWHHR
jgi:competence protein ComEC